MHLQPHLALDYNARALQHSSGFALAACGLVLAWLAGSGADAVPAGCCRKKQLEAFTGRTDVTEVAQKLEAAVYKVSNGQIVRPRCLLEACDQPVFWRGALNVIWAFGPYECSCCARQSCLQGLEALRSLAACAGRMTTL